MAPHKLALALGALLLAAAPARAEVEVVDLDGADAPRPAPTWTIAAFASQRWLADPSAAALTTDTLGGGGLAVERPLLDLPVPGGLAPVVISAELAFEAAAADGLMFQQLATSISTWALTAGARARLPLRSWLQLQGRASLGGGRTTVEVAAPDMSNGISDHARTALASAGLGAALRAPIGRGRFRAGVDVEVGYQVTTATEVRAVPEDRPEPSLTIPATYASLGDVDTSGWTLRFGASIGF